MASNREISARYTSVDLVGGRRRSPARRGDFLDRDESNEFLFSVVSIWEIVIKRGRGHPQFKIDPTQFRCGLINIGFEEIGISSDHAIAVGHLPPLHRDPFDRILVAQATVEGVTLLTADALLARYPGPIRHV